MTDHFSLPRDDVPRLAAYRETHPDVTITPPEPGGSLRWVARKDGRIIAADYWLGALLDTLDWLDGLPG